MWLELSEQEPGWLEEGLETWPGAFQAASLGLQSKSTGKLGVRSEGRRAQRWM